MSCPNCFSGHVRDDCPVGKEKVIHGRNTYVAEPASGTAAKGIIIIVPDAFGWQFVNNKILADHYASKAKCLVYLPDFMDGKAAPVWMIDVFAGIEKSSMFAMPYHIVQAMYGFIPHLITNRFGVAMPRVKSFFEAVRANEGAILPIAGAGFCWGAKHIVNLAHGLTSPDGKALLDVAFIAHPSAVEIPAELEKLKRPLSLAIGTRDIVVSIAQTEEMKKIFGGLSEVDTEVVVYEGAGHGFAVRADPNCEKQSAQSIEAEDQAVKWFEKHFVATEL